VSTSIFRETASLASSAGGRRQLKPQIFLAIFAHKSYLGNGNTLYRVVSSDNPKSTSVTMATFSA
jgi:hypothetical protein